MSEKRSGPPMGNPWEWVEKWAVEQKLKILKKQ